MSLFANFDEVRADVSRYVREIEEQKGTLIREIVLQALSDAHTLSPVATGRYRASHTISEGDPDVSPAPFIADAVRNPPSGDPRYQKIAQESIARAEVVLRTVDRDGVGGKSFFLTSNVSYANDLERGTSAQAPQGVYSKVRLRAMRNFTAEFARLGE